MATLAAIKSEGNLRCNHFQHSNKAKPIKVHSPKVRLRLKEATDNYEKANTSAVKYSLNPAKSEESLNYKFSQPNNGNYLTSPVVNRNKICQMDKIIFPSCKDKYIDDKRVPRCLGTESLSYSIRNRGSLLIVGSGETQYVPEDIHIRCPTREAEDNLVKGRGLRMMNVLQHSVDYKDNPPVARIRDELAAEISKKHQGGSMSDLMHPTRSYHSDIAREPRCPTAEAMDTYKKHRGDSMSIVMGNKTENDPMPSSSKKRVKDSDGNDIEPQRSAGVTQVMNASNEASYSYSKYEPRVRLSGKEVAEKNRGTLTSDIYNSGSVGSSPVHHQEPRVVRQGKEVAASSTGFLTKQLFERYGQYPKDPKPPARVSRSALKISRQSRGGAMRDALCPPRQPHSKRHIRSAHR